MIGRRSITLLLVVVAAATSALAQAPTTPSRPKLTAAEEAAARSSAPFKQFSAWLDAFNSGDRDRIAKYIETNHPTAALAGQLNFRERTGGFALRTLEYASATQVIGVVQEQGPNENFARFTLTVDGAPPHRITTFPMLVIPRPAEFALPPMTDAELASKLREKLERDAAADRFGGAALFARITDAARGETRVLFSGAYGKADRGTGIANTIDTRFRMGSMNKMFTAVSVLTLVQAGKIKLDATVGTYVPDYPNRDVASKVTIHHLLSHQGGTGDFFGPQFEANRLSLKTHTDYVKLYGGRAPLFEPGSRWAYSNYGMILLGYIIERVTGGSYYDYVAEHVFKPAGMTRSGSEPEDANVEGRAVGYMAGQASGGGPVPNTNTLPYRGTAAGGGYTTVGDLLKFATALMGNRLLRAEYTNLLITGKVAAGDAMYAYGFRDARGGEGSVGHSGGAPGMSGDLRIYPKSGHVLIALSNFDVQSAVAITSFLAQRLAK
jgi:D-alanyl-D-alanine carboxypeptidase